MEYNETDIFKDRTIYVNYIKDKFENFKKTKNLNFSENSKFEKIFKYGKYKKDIKLSLNSLEISFKNLAPTPDSKEKNLKIDLPFSLLPIFYYKGINSFIKFLSIIISINNFENIVFCKEKIFEALEDIKDYNNTNEGINEDGEKISSKNIKKNYIIDLKPNTLNTNNSYLKNNYFIFFWTTNIYTYATTIKLPSIHVSILENKININHFIDYELLIYLFQKNFANWEYYIIKYLSTYSKFRNIFQQIGSLQKIYNKTILLKEPKTKMNSFSQEILINIYADQFNKNQILLFNSFYIDVNLIDLNYNQEQKYRIHFNFFHYLKLYQIAKYSSKLLFLIKFIEINKEFNSLNFDFEEFDKFNAMSWLDNIQKFSNKSLKNNVYDEELSTEFNVFSKKIHVELKRPCFSLVKIENKNEIKKSWEIGNELEGELIDSIANSSSDSWTKLLNECLQKLDEPIPILPKVHNKKRFHKNQSKNNLYIPSENEKNYKKRFSKILK